MNQMNKTAYEIGKIDGQLNNYSNPYDAIVDTEEGIKYRSYEEGYAEGLEKRSELLSKRANLIRKS